MQEEFSRLEDNRVLIHQEDVEDYNELQRIYFPRTGGLSKEEINALFTPEMPAQPALRISAEDFDDVVEKLDEIEEKHEKKLDEIEEKNGEKLDEIEEKNEHLRQLYEELVRVYENKKNDEPPNKRKK